MRHRFGAAAILGMALLVDPAFAQKAEDPPRAGESAGLSAAEVWRNALWDTGVVSYGTLIETGPESFVVTDLRARGGLGPGEFEIDRFVVTALDVPAMAEGRLPGHFDMRLEGLRLRPEHLPDGDAMALLGLSELLTDVRFAYVFEDNTLNLDDLTVDFRGLGRISLSMVIGGLDPDLVVSSPESAVFTAVLNWARLEYHDGSLLARLLDVGAQLQGVTTPALLDEGLAHLEQSAGAFAAGAAGPVIERALDQLRAFLLDYEGPRGPLVVALQPAQPMALMGLMMGAGSPDALIRQLGLSVDYER